MLGINAVGLQSQCVMIVRRSERPIYRQTGETWQSLVDREDLEPKFQALSSSIAAGDLAEGLRYSKQLALALENILEMLREQQD